MRSIQYVALLAVLTLMFSLGAFAKSSNSGGFDLGQTARIGSTVLHPGHYKAEWVGPSNALQISILEHGKTVATTQGNLKQLPEKSPNDSVTLRTHRDNSAQVDEIDFSNRSQALTFGGS